MKDSIQKYEGQSAVAFSLVALVFGVLTIVFSILSK